MNTAPETYYEHYLREGFKALRCRGNHSKYNPAKVYQDAKVPIDKGFTNPGFIGMSLPEILDWAKQGGWPGFLIPEGAMFIDAEGQEKLNCIDSMLRSRDLSPPTHITNNGRHYGFENSNGLTGDSKVFTKSGIDVTYRIGGKNQLILAPVNGRTWLRKFSREFLSPLPDDLLPYDRKNLREVLNNLSWQVGVHFRNKNLQGYEDVDFAFMAYLIQAGIGYEDIQSAFNLIFLNEYDLRRTDELYQRTKSKIESGEKIVGAGSFIHLIKDRDDLKLVYRFAQELQALTGHKNDERSKNRFPKILRAVSVHEMLTMEFKPREAILSPWLHTQGLAMIYAYRGVGKTLVAIGIAIATSSSGEFLCWTAPRPVGVLYIDGEMPGGVLQQRIAQAIKSSRTESTAPLRIITPDLQENGMPDLSSPEGQDALEPHLDGVSLIIVDNISTLCRSGRENEGESWLPLQEWALRLRSRGYSIIFIHHSGKGGQQRGTSKREDVLDVVIHLKHPGDYRPEQGARFETHFEKARMIFGEVVKPFEACLITNPDGTQEWAMKDLEQSLTERVADLLNEGVPQNEIPEMLGVTKGTVSKHKAKARTLGLLQK